jgi:hypothetical protein
MKKYEPGITFRSMGVLLLLLLLTVAVKQYVEVILGIAYPSEHTLPLPALWVFLGFLIVSGLVKRFTSRRILSRAEMLCVLFALLIAGPLITQGGWHRILSITATIPKTGDFNKMDALSDRIWPHGPNLLQGKLNKKGVSGTKSVVWEKREVFKNRDSKTPVLCNVDGGDSHVRFSLPVGAGGIRPRVSYLVSFLVHASNLGPESKYFVRAYTDTANPDRFTELLSSSLETEPSFMFPSGFQRRGMYDVSFEPSDDSVILEFGLTGAGTVAIADPKLMDVSALELAYKGRQIIQERDARLLAPEELEGLVIRPDSMFSLAGFLFILKGYILVKDWVPMIFAWTSLIVLLLTATFALAVLMRRQWLDNERYPLPIAYISAALIGKDGEAPIWKNRMIWAGFTIGLLWCLVRGFNFYNPRVPDLNISIPMGPYFANSQFRPMWNGVVFNVSAIFLSLAMFMELGVLMSIVVGFLLFRGLFWFGNLTGISSNAGYPFDDQQQVGAYLMYALLVIVFTRKYWGSIIKAAVRNDLSASEGEAFSYRTAFIILGLCFAGAAAWAWWLGIGIAGILVFFFFMVTTGLVCAKVRAECGTPFSYFAPNNGMLVIFMLGGLTVFGAGTVVTALMFSFVLFVTAFFLIPGAQVELLEMGRERGVVPRHLFYAMLSGVIGGMLIGGWVFLSNAYAFGGNNMKFGWAFDQKSYYFYAMNTDMAQAARQLAGEATEAVGIRPETWAYAYAAGGVLLLSVLRQFFAGFWFHPVGFMLGSTHFSTTYVWGSCLAAWVIRLTVLKLGGAATVRERLRPFFIGVFIAAVLSQLLFSVHAGFLAADGIENVYRGIP